MAVRLKRSKYGNHKTVVDGIKFDSQAESRRYLQLKMLQKGKRIMDLQTQVRFPITVRGTKVCDYVCDFRYFDLKTNAEVVEDVKGVKTAVYRLKKKLMMAVHGIDIAEVTA